jgi:tetratricopeptide (TPR) repeat protein
VRMSARARILAVVAVATVAAAGVAVAAGLRGSESEEAAEPAATRPAGPPPLALDLGLGDDARTRELRRAGRLYSAGRLREAGEIFRRYGSLPAQIGAAFSAWPVGTVERVRTLVASHPRSGQARLHLGLALYWSRRLDQAVAAWRAAVRVDPDSPAAIRANDLLHPDSPQGLPTFVPSFAAPRGLAGVPPARQLAVLARRASTGGVRDKLLYGVALQRAGRPVSAERAYARASRLAPRNVEAQVAAAVGRFRKDRPARAFSRLGPLAQRYPGSPTVRFHLGLLLIWLGELDDAKRQLALARDAGPRSQLGKEANRFLSRLESSGSK